MDYYEIISLATGVWFGNFIVSPLMKRTFFHGFCIGGIAACLVSMFYLLMH